MREEYFIEEIEDEERGSEKKTYVLIIYDITDNRLRVKMAKVLEGYGKRIQKSAFEAMLTAKAYRKLLGEIPQYMDRCEDSVRVYKIRGDKEVISYGKEAVAFEDEVIII